MSLTSETKDVFLDAGKTSLILFKIMIPISVIVKILTEYGIIEIIGDSLTPVMNTVGLPGEFGLVWATAMITNLYGGMIVFFNLSLTNIYNVAEVTVLAVMMLVAHNLPVEVRIVQKAGVSALFNIILRVCCAIIIGFILSFIFTNLNLLQINNQVLWLPGINDPTLQQWIIDQLRTYAMIFLIILSLIILMRVLKKTGILEKMNNFMEPGLRFLGLNKNAAPLTIIGLTMGLAYGGGLIIKETKEKALSKKDAFLSLSLMSLSHSLIEDTLLMFTIGASIIGILFGRIIFTFIIIIILIRIINRLSKKTFNKYFSR
jgi:hypothetical protein